MLENVHVLPSALPLLEGIIYFMATHILVQEGL